MIGGNFFPNIEVDIKPNINIFQSEQYAQQFLSIKTLRQDRSSELVIFPKEGKYVLAYKVITLGKEPLQDWLTMVNTQTGKVIYLEDITVILVGSGYVCQKEPVNSNLTSVTLPRLSGAGSYSKQCNSATMSSGIYFCRMQAGSYSETKELVLL
jgi:hypothetical protein